VEETLEAGVSLLGSEVKSARDGKVGLADAYAIIEAGEAWLVNAHISEYSHGNIMNHPPARARKLLLHRAEIEKLAVQTQQKGLSLIPTKVYTKSGRIKVEIAVARGKKFHDKRQSERAKTAEEEARQAVRAHRF
jgi:SsrA-binding protein